MQNTKHSSNPKDIYKSAKKKLKNLTLNRVKLPYLKF